MILGILFVSVFAVGFYSYFIAVKIYESKAAILPPREGGGGSSLAAAFSSSAVSQLLGGLGSLLPSGGSNRDVFVAILKSRTMAEEIISRFNLKDYYKAQYVVDAIRILQQVTDITISKEGVISIAVEDKDPKLAADIANAYVTNLDRLFVKLGTTDASRQRAFIAERLETTEKLLRGGEEALRRFQEKNKAVVLTEQSRSAIEAAAQLRGYISVAEVQLEAMRSYATETNPQVVQLKRQIDEMKRQLARMEYGKGLETSPGAVNVSPDGQDFQLPFAKVPGLGMELVRLTREVKVQETVFNLLTAQYEQAKIAEARDTPTVQFLDRAVPADRKSKPIVRLNMAIAGVLSLLLGIFLAFFLEYLERVRAHVSKLA